MNSSQLSRWLQKNQPPPVWLVCGDEHLQLSETVTAIRQHAKAGGCDERVVLNTGDAGFQWQEVQACCASMSLFSSKRLVEVHMGSRDPGRGVSAAIVQSLQRPDASLVLLFIFEKNDGRTRKAAWYKKIAEQGEVVSTVKVNAAELPAWLVTRARGLGFKLDMAAAEWIADNTEGNLMAAAQELNIWQMSGQDPVLLEDVLNAVSDNARFNIFDLLRHAWSGNAKRTFRMLRGLRDEGVEPVAMLGALLWDLRRLCKVAASSGGSAPGKSLLIKHGIYGDGQQAATSFITRRGLPGLYKTLAVALQTERVLKSGDKDRAWRSMHWLFYFICNPKDSIFSE